MYSLYGNIPTQPRTYCNENEGHVYSDFIQPDLYIDFTANICVCPRAVHLYRIPHTSYPILKYTEEYTYKFTHLQIHLPTCLPINISIYTSLFILYIYIHLFYFFCFIYLSILQVNLIETNQSIDLNVCDTI